MVADGSAEQDVSSFSLKGKERIIEKIISDAESEAADVLSFAEKQVQEIRGNAMNESAEMRKRMLAKGTQEAMTEKNRILSQARLDARKKVLEAKEREISAVINEANLVLTDPGKIADYPDVMKKISLEACNALGGGNLVIKTDVSGADVLKAAKKDLEKEVAKTTSKDTKLSIVDDDINGVLVVSEEGVVVNNTFSTRLERKRRDIRKELASILFR